MIWLGIEKTKDKWICKNPEVNLNGYEGSVSDCNQTLIKLKEIGFQITLEVQ